MSYSLTVRHIDTCLSCYLQDHHNRAGECLLGVIVDRSSRVHGVKSQLIDAADIEGDFPDDMTDAEIRAAINEAFEGAHPLKAWDKSLDSRSPDDDGESCQSWFLFQWETTEDAPTLAQDGDSKFSNNAADMPDGHEDKTRVAFRVFSEGDVIAIFPDHLHNGMMDSYQHVGQHGLCSPELLSELRPATDEETASLVAELTGEPYNYYFVPYDAATLAQNGDSDPAAPDVASNGETAPMGRCEEIRAGFGYNQDLVSAYLWHRQRERRLPAHKAMERARKDVQNKIMRYPDYDHAEFSAWGPRNKAVRYIPDVNAIGIRYVGSFHDIVRTDHIGWFTSENGDNGEIVQGQVFQIPGRNGKPIFLAGHSDPNNDSAATIDFGTLYTGSRDKTGWWAHGEQDKRDAARAGDEMARRYGEDETEHGRHWQAGARFVDIGADHAEARKATIAALAELRPDRGRFVSCRHLIIADYLSKRQEVREEQAKLEAEHGGTAGFLEHINP